MFEIILAITVVALTVAVVGLFAMMGELASRVPDPTPSESDMWPQALDEARLGAQPDSWPGELSELSDAAHAVLVVLSTSCTTCGRLAGGVTGEFVVPAETAAVVVACPTEEAGRAFVAEHRGLHGLRVLIDPAGEWTRTAFDVSTSPSALVLSQGRLLSAHTVTTAAALRRVGEMPVDEQSTMNREELHAGH
ncbi:hypothetical protein [Paractinoplanes hotanensis]|uniref:Thioredoxin domain-containing protein n=1 Tax=Paractinoplanes hotanensis TaxID=2906497 RepID=A0ABT0Y4C9_9ACTN|nr:hypothetical protein [Actinoplanes hotanensis]MCM4080893.1 hypothetical protein [Actinoplanes hotanensis]